MRLAAVTRNSCIRFATNSMLKKLKPVASPPGRLRLFVEDSPVKVSTVRLAGIW
jgi:hypothetical protein